MSFTPRSKTLSGRFVVHAEVSRVFPMFSPLGEKKWVPGWDPELLHPPSTEWDEGLIFRTREGDQESIWVVTSLDWSTHEVSYHRVEPGRLVANVRVRCHNTAASETEAQVIYTFVGLTHTGSELISRMTARDYAAKMTRWRDWISDSLS